MTITFDEFRRQLIGARSCDLYRWTELEQEKELWKMFAFGNFGCHYIPAEQRRTTNFGALAFDYIKLCDEARKFEARWIAKVENNPGYFEPAVWTVQ